MAKLIYLLMMVIVYLFGFTFQKEEKKLEGYLMASVGNSVRAAFDNNLNSEFKGIDPSGAWIGYELYQPSIITKIGWAQNRTDKNNYLLGIFEGANEKNFIDALPLHMITLEGKIGEMNYISIDLNITFKYVRYCGPYRSYSIISELEFYGYQPEEEPEGDITFYQPTELPLVVIHTNDTEDPRSTFRYLDMQMFIIDGGKKNLLTTGGVRLRGNRSVRLPKKPFKIKLTEKQNILDFPAKAKKWTFIANYDDKSLIRNLLALKLSSILGFKWTPACKPVDLMFNGEYKGNYLLCDQLDVRKGRMELDIMDQSMNEEPEITGGYLFEASKYATSDTIYGESTKGIPYSIRYPDRDEITDEQLSYLKNFVNTIEDEVYSGVYDHIDSDSFIKFLLVQEIAANADSLWSVYMHKERGDDKLYFGPIWDFDLSFGNDIRVFPVSNRTNFIFKYSNKAKTMDVFVEKILNNKKILQRLKDKWKELFEGGLKDQLKKFIDEEANIIKDSATLNFLRWDILIRITYMNPIAKCTYEGEIEYLKDFLDERFTQLNDIIGNATVDFVNQKVDATPGAYGADDVEGFDFLGKVVSNCINDSE